MALTPEDIKLLHEVIDDNHYFSDAQRTALHESVAGILTSIDKETNNTYEILDGYFEYLNQMKTKFLTISATSAVDKVINDPVHAIFNDNNTNQLYTDKTRSCLIDRVVNIMYALNMDNMSTDEKITAINDYVKDNVTIRKPYFDAFEGRSEEFNENELRFRTAYSALTKTQAMCAGISETCRILCETAGFKTQALLSRLPGKNKHLIHYVTLVTTPDGRHFILDPDRQASCEKKFYDFKQYQNNMLYFTPTHYYIESKTTNKGVGPDVDEYLNHDMIGETLENSRLFLIDDNEDVFAITNDGQIKVENLSTLLNSDTFVKDVKSLKASFLVQGTKNIGCLAKIMETANAPKTQNKNNQNNPSELGG